MTNQKAPAAGTSNPFADDADRHAIWSMLVERDIEAFVAADWSKVEDDFIADGFYGLDGGAQLDPDAWSLRFASLDDYAASWIHQARAVADVSDLSEGLYAATILDRIDVVDDTAVAHKKFDGWLTDGSGERTRLDWQTIYVCRKVDGQWRIASFVGYLMNNADARPAESPPPKVVPPRAAQHTTAGPYSPVLSVRADNLIVISGQAAIDADGSITSALFDAQVRATLENCRRQLEYAGSTLDDVFKTNVYLTDLNHWHAFNVIYEEMMSPPLPVRTAIGATLLPGLLVEVEMWAVGRSGSGYPE